MTYYNDVKMANRLILSQFERMLKEDMDKKDAIIEITQLVKNRFGFGMNFVKRQLREAGFNYE